MDDCVSVVATDALGHNFLFLIKCLHFFRQIILHFLFILMNDLVARHYISVQQRRLNLILYDPDSSIASFVIDPMLWSPAHVNSWVMFTLQHFNLPLVPAEYFNMDGAALVALTEEEFNQRAPQVRFQRIKCQFFFKDYLQMEIKDVVYQRLLICSYDCFEGH